MKTSSRSRHSFFRVLTILFLVIIGLIVGTAIGTVKTMPTWDPDKLYGHEGSLVLDHQGNEVTTLHASENRTLVPYEKIPPDLINAFIAVEDTDFYRHHGVNFKAIVRAAFIDIVTGSKAQGASTITQQLARNAFLTSDKSYKRKVQEMVLAIELERHYTKKEILEMYLNKVNFGSGAYGVQAAARLYFGKDVSDLNLAESALIAGLVQSPNRYSPFKNPELAKRRQLQVLNRMVETGFISLEEREKAAAAELKYADNADSAYPYGPYIDNVIEECHDILLKLGYDNPDHTIYYEGLRIYTGMDTEVQKLADSIYDDPKNFPSIKSSRGEKVQSAMAIVNPHTGEIIALAGGRDYNTRRAFNRATMAKRQPGSSFKPIVVYAPALEAGFMPFTVLEDSLTSYDLGNGTSWTPKNYDNVYRGPITMREAVKRSVNTYAVKLADQVGIRQGIKLAEKMGISTLVKAGPHNDYNLSTALGGLTKGVTPLEMASAFGVFANEGVYVKPHAVNKIVDAHGNVIYKANPVKNKAISSETAWLMTSLLKSVVYDEGGTGHRAQVPGMITCGKTGTTSDNKDAWFVGFTPYYACAVWMGFDQAEDLHNTYGGTYPALIFKQIMTKAVKGKPNADFAKPDTIVSVTVCRKSGLIPSPYCPIEDQINEYCVKGKEPQAVCSYHGITQNTSEYIEICPESGLLATPNCPNPILKSPAEFAPGTAPTEYCPLHQETVPAQ